MPKQPATAPAPVVAPSRSPVAATASDPGQRFGARPGWFVVAMSVGVVLGAGTLLMQRRLPDGWNVLANSGVVWSIGAFAVGLALRQRRVAMVGGATALVSASWSYYLTADWLERAGFSTRGVVVWSIAGVIAGSAFGLAGSVTRRSDYRHAALSTMAGVTVGEGVHLTWFVGNADLRPAGILEIVLGAAVVLGCVACTSGRRHLVPLAAVAGCASTLAAISLISRVFGAI